MIVARNRAPDFLEQGRDNTISMELQEDGATLTPSAGSLTVKDGAGATISTPAVSFVGGIATATVTTADLAGKAFASNWTEVWELTLSGVVKRFLRPAIHCLQEPYNPVGESDLEAVHSDLFRANALPVGRTSWQDYSDEAFLDFISFTMSTPFPPHTIVDWFRVRPYLVTTSLERVSRDLLTVEGGNGKWTLLNEMYREKAPIELRRLGYRTDRDEDGLIDSTDETMASPGVNDGAPQGRRW